MDGRQLELLVHKFTFNDRGVARGLREKEHGDRRDKEEETMVKVMYLADT